MSRFNRSAELAGVAIAGLLIGQFQEEAPKRAPIVAETPSETVRDKGNQLFFKCSSPSGTAVVVENENGDTFLMRQYAVAGLGQGSPEDVMPNTIEESFTREGDYDNATGMVDRARNFCGNGDPSP